ncbi:5'-methylthioadenosine/S-adenosylhomocysteine nucleosidase [Streptomyces sp. NPDC060184]|uniref:5'-methylthioadenosine/S-adenosylhomocysteine nucleosidase n=1 Tax=Streptomyces sp. NPDC060184 TaxID=3347064 RepID=UPI00365A06B8
MSDPAPFIAVLTALPVEYLAVREHVTDIEPLVHPHGTRVESARLPGTPWRIALVEAGVGAGATAVLTERVAHWFNPQAVLFVGVAGGLKSDIQVGHVVVATKVYGIHGGKQSPGRFEVRPDVWPSSHRLDQAARAALRGRGGVHFKPIASGDVVLADAESEIAAYLRANFNDAAALDMEGAGLVQAAHLAGGLDALVIRGVSDKADAEKFRYDAQGSQELASRNAAEVTVAILRTLEPVRPRDRTIHAPRSASSRETASGPIRAPHVWGISESEYEVLSALARSASRSLDGRLEESVAVEVAAEASPHLSPDLAKMAMRLLIDRGYLRASPSGRMEVSSNGLQALARGRKK